MCGQGRQRVKLDQDRVQDLLKGVLRGDQRSIARAISWAERQVPQARVLLAGLYPHTGQAHLIGVTGSPGTGKSTLVNQLARAYRQCGSSVGVIAVDPTSPFSGGALLGDRIRMRDVAGDPGVFVRSMATRGALGGLSRATFDAAQILDAGGYNVILIETVGVGQDEVEIARTAHTTVVVEAPGLGDDIQTIKAGLMEIADIYVVNKADRDGADQAVRALEAKIDLDRATSAASAPTQEQTWEPMVCKAIALDGTGIAELVTAIKAHRAYLVKSGRLKEKEQDRARSGLKALLSQELLTRFLSRLEPGKLDSVLFSIAARELSLHEALEQLLTDR